MATYKQFIRTWVAMNRRCHNEKWAAEHLDCYLIANRDEWVYCPKCKLEWNPTLVNGFPPEICVYQAARHLLKTNVEDKEKRPDKLCPIHGECIMDGRIMGKRRHVNKRTVDKLNEAARIPCPKCKSYDLKHIQEDTNLWRCGSCNSIITIKQGYLNGESGWIGVLEISYREDLGTTDELLSKVFEIIESPGVVVKETK
jgi:ribosomal protein L37AE/L43A